MELPDIIKKQIDELVDGLKIKNLNDRTLPGWIEDALVLHKNGKPYFILFKNIMGFIDVKIFPSASNLIYFGYEQSPDMQEYLEKSLKDSTGLNFDMSYVMNREEEKKFADILIPLLQGGMTSSNQ